MAEARLHQQQRLRIDVEGGSYQHRHLGIQSPLAIEHLVQLAVGNPYLRGQHPLRHIAIFDFILDYFARMGCSGMQRREQEDIRN